MASEHTPGPWTAYKSTGRSQEWVVDSVARQEPPFQWCPQMYTYGASLSEADARLIAAAPDHHQALIDDALAFTAILACDSLDQAKAIAKERNEVVRGNVAKAKGKEGETA